MLASYCFSYVRVDRLATGLDGIPNSGGLSLLPYITVQLLFGASLVLVCPII